MANITEIGINWSAFNSINQINETLNFGNQTKQEFINSIPTQANNMTYDFYGIIVLIILLIYLIWYLGDKSQYGQFRYSNVRSLGVGLGIVSTLGVIMVMTGFMTNFIHLSTLVTLYIFILIYIYVNNPE